MPARPDTAPRFSVVVPCYNVRAWVGECLDSVLDQDIARGDVEVIAVDDASPDGLGEILDGYAARDDRVLVVHLDENVGLGRARNAGLPHCTGDYVLFLDSDDTLAPGSLRAIADRLDSTGGPDAPVDVLLFDYTRTYWDGRSVRNRLHATFAEHGDGVFTAAGRPEFLSFLMVVWNKAYRRAFLDAEGFSFPPGYYEDMTWTYQTMLTAARIATLDRVVVCYRQRRQGGNILATTSRKHFDVFDQYDRLFGWLTEHPELEQRWAPFLFDRMLDHDLAILGEAGRLPPGDRREFFGVGHDQALRLRPPGYRPDATRRGQKRRLVLSGDFDSYERLGRAARTVRETKRAARAARRRATAVPRRGLRLARRLPARPPLETLRRARQLAERQARQRGTYRNARRRPLDPQLAVFAASWYRAFNCNPRSIHESMTRLAPDVRGVWVAHRDVVDKVPPGLDHVVAESKEYYDLIARATYFVNNVNFGPELVKRRGQVHLQTQHGTPLKTMGLDLQAYPTAAGDTDFASMMRRVDRWDHNLSQNRFSTVVWEKTFPAHYDTWEYGYPRNDLLLTSDLDTVRAARRRIGCDDDALFCVLYAPTFREGTGWQPLDVVALAERLGPYGRVLVRPHPALPNVAGATGHAHGGAAPDVHDRVLDVSEPDVGELQLAADALITDYSSIMFDYAALDRPIVLLADDWDAYRQDRGTYFDVFEDSPGLTINNEKLLLDAFEDGSFDDEVARGNRGAFRARFSQFDDGRSAERVVRALFLGETDQPPMLGLDDRRPAPSAHR